jgi:hypothetical protein
MKNRAIPPASQPSDRKSIHFSAEPPHPRRTDFSWRTPSAISVTRVDP